MRKNIIIIDSRGKVSKTFTFGAAKLVEVMKKIIEYAFKIEQGK